MKSKMKGFIVVLTAVLLLGIGVAVASTQSSAASLSNSRSKRADKIAKYTIENWEKYGVWPSVAVGQALIESGVGEVCRAYNYWGIMGRKYNFSTLENGVKSYCRVINNGYYGSAPFAKTAQKQISQIASHGYCQPSNGYYSKVYGAIKRYNLKKYDKQLKTYIKKKKEKAKKAKLKKIEEKKKAKEKAKLKKELAKLNNTLFFVKYDPIVPEGSLGVSNIKDISCLFNENSTLGVYNIDRSTHLGIYNIFDYSVNNVTPIHKYNINLTYKDKTIYDSRLLYTSDKRLLFRFPIVRLECVDAKG